MNIYYRKTKFNYTCNIISIHIILSKKLYELLQRLGGHWCWAAYLGQHKKKPSSIQNQEYPQVVDAHDTRYFEDIFVKTR